MKATDGGIRPDRIIERLGGGSERELGSRTRKLPSLVRFSGFVGEETSDEFIELVDPDDFTHVIEIPKKGIHYIVPENRELTPPDGTSLWIDPDAECRHTVPGDEIQRFLAGAIAEGAYGMLLDDSGRIKCNKWKSFSR